MLPFSIFVRHWVFNKTFLLSSFDAMRRVRSKSTNFAPVDIWLIFALSFFYTKSVHFYFQTKCLCITLCVLTKVMDSALYLYLLRSRRRQYYLIWGAAPVQQHTTALKEKWFWAQELTTAAPHNAAHECVVQQRHARGAGERERGGEMNLSFDAAKCWSVGCWDQHGGGEGHHNGGPGTGRQQPALRES